MYSVYVSRLQTKDASIGFSINRTGDNRISHDFSSRLFCLDSRWIPGWGGGGLGHAAVHRKSRFWSRAGGNTGIPLSLWYAKLVSGFEKEIFTHTVCYLMYPHPQISASIAYRQTLLLALETVQRYTVSINSRSSRQPLKKKNLLLFFFLFFFFSFPSHLARVSSDGQRENKSHVNSTTLPRRSMLPEYQVLIMKSFVWELPGLPPRLVFISQSVPPKRQLPCDSRRI